MSEKARALILRASDYSETSLVVTLLTDRLGLVRALAKGAKRPGSRLYGGLGRFTLASVVLYPRKTGLFTLGEADFIDGLPALGDNLKTYFAAHYAAELLLGTSAEGDPCPEVFALAETAFRRLARSENVPHALLVFEAGLLRLSGHLPSATECASCQARLPRGEVLFSPPVGGALCPSCASEALPGSFPIRRGTLALVARFAEPQGVRVEKARLPRASRAEMRHVLSASFSAIMERKLRTLRYVLSAGEPVARST
jgi:DNA repair protein RecO (recombination protein O)